MASRIETETTVTGIQEDNYFLIGTNWAAHVNRLDKEVTKGRAELVSVQGEWREYKAHKDHFNPLTGWKTQRVLTDAQRAASGERLRAARLNKLEGTVTS